MNDLTNLLPATQQYISNAPPEIRDVLASGAAAHQAEKTALVRAITSNERNVFTAEQLQAMSLDSLRGIAALACPAGRLRPVENVTEEPLQLPTMDFSN